ncbi:hypothetical protein V1514DRAFT_334327 [Lipomyces japonicus]|uniref:uncharacterized protein n=1 Tax=Lipomyces japonicus TaxID=56871 RepID=UPI0034CFFA60
MNCLILAKGQNQRACLKVSNVIKWHLSNHFTRLRPDLHISLKVFSYSLVYKRNFSCSIRRANIVETASHQAQNNYVHPEIFALLKDRLGIKAQNAWELSETDKEKLLTFAKNGPSISNAFKEHQKVVDDFRNHNVFLNAQLAESEKTFTIENFWKKIMEKDNLKIEPCQNSYGVDQRLWNFIISFVISGLSLPNLHHSVTAWSNKWKIMIRPTKGQSMLYVDTLVERFAENLGADLIRINDIDLDLIVGNHMNSSPKLSSLQLDRIYDVNYLFRDDSEVKASEYQSAVDDEDDFEPLQNTLDDYFLSVAYSIFDTAHSKRSHESRENPIIVHVQDYDEIVNSALGEIFIAELESLIGMKRWLGQRVIMIASSRERHAQTQAQQEQDHTRAILAHISHAKFESPQVKEGMRNGSNQHNEDESGMLDLSIPLSNLSYNANAASETAARYRLINASYIDIYLQRSLGTKWLEDEASESSYDRTLNGNTEHDIEYSHNGHFKFLNFPHGWEYDASPTSGIEFLSAGILEPQRLFTLITILKGQMIWQRESSVNTHLFEEAVEIVKGMDHLHDAWIKSPQTFGIEHSGEASNKPTDTSTKTKDSSSTRKNLDALDLNKRENLLINRLIEPADIRVTFEDVIAPKSTIDSLNDSISLSLSMPYEFSYGVLANHHVSGVLLYGPPGTGKTMLVKALAKSGDTRVLDIKPSDILHKYVGEAEKNVDTLFSLARKLKPCVIFIDEVDALLANRSDSSKYSKTRETINQFMLEWDGIKSDGILLIGATNRPFDLDDAVLRRFPRRILVDLPTEENRRDIFKIHLQGEQLDSSVNLDDLVKSTVFFSGSDIKNVCVTAALEAVKEIKASRDHNQVDTESYKKLDSANCIKGPTRILQKHHFDKALKVTGSSISDEMSSITAIRDWHKQFGQTSSGKAQRKKMGFTNTAPQHETRVAGDH